MMSKAGIWMSLGQEMRPRKMGMRLTGAVAGLVTLGLLVLAGCAGFFPPITNSGGGGSGTSTGTVYTINATTNTVSGFEVGTGTLTATTNSPYALGYTPQAAVVTIPNTFLYVAGPNSIYSYAIASDGSLSAGTAQAVASVVSMDVSPDGQWLIALDGTSTQLDVFKINTSTAALSLTGTMAYPVTTTPVVPKMVKISADSGTIFAALGTNGDVTFSFTTSTGAVSTLVQVLAPISTQTSDNALAVNSAGTYLYIARTGTGAGLASYSIGSGGVLTSVNGSPVAAGTQPLAVVLDSTGTYAYVANGSDATVSAYSLANGVGTLLSGAPYASGALVRSLVLDSTKKYLLAAAPGGSPDLTMYSFATSPAGGLVKATTAATGTDPAGTYMVVSTH